MEKYVGLPAKAAVMIYALAKSQACIDGNKRIAFILLNEFLAINGALLEMPDDEAVAMVLQAAESDAQFRDQTILQVTQILEDAIQTMKGDEQ